MIKRLYVISFEDYMGISKREFLELKKVVPKVEFNLDFSQVNDGDFSMMPDDYLGQLHITSKGPIIVDPLFVNALDVKVPFRVEEVIDVQMSVDAASLFNNVDSFNSTEPV